MALEPMNRAQHIILLITEAFNKGEKIALGGAAALGAGMLAHHIAQKHGVDIHQVAHDAKEAVKGHVQRLTDKVQDALHGTTTTRTASHASSNVETPQTRPYTVEKHYDTSGNVTGETHHSTLANGTRVETHHGETPFHAQKRNLGPEHKQLKEF